MIPQAEQLWTRLLAQLRRHGRLPLRSEQLTPQEIAAHCYEADGDDRGWRFVHDYYYPHHFGQTAGALSEAEAEALVTSFEPGAKAALRPAPDSPDSPPAPPVRRPLCQICKHRPVPSQPA